MDEASTDDIGVDVASDADACRAAPPWWMVFAVAVAVVGVRWWVTRHRIVFQFRSDEAGQIGMSRIISGGTTWNMFSNVTWRPGYATLIAPLHWVIDDPTTFYRASMVVNSLLGGLSAALLVVIAGRLVSVPPAWVAVFSLVASLMPGAVLTANWVWAESLVTAVFLGCVLAGLFFVESPNAGRGVVLVGLATVGLLTHGRLAGLLVSAIGLVIWAWRAGRLGGRFAAGLVVGAAGGVVLVELFTSWLVDRMYTRALSTNTVGRVLGNLGDPVAVMINAAGQVWYQSVTTLLMTVVGAVVIVRKMFTGNDDACRRAAAVTVAAMTLPVAGTAAVFLSDTPQLRADYVVYGRYLDAVVGPLIVVGLSTLWFGSLRTRILAGSVAVVIAIGTAGIVGQTRSAQLQQGRLVEHMVLGLLGFLPDSGDVDVARITATSLAISVALIALTSVAGLLARPVVLRGAAVVGLAVVVAILGRSASSEIQPRLNRLQAARAVEQVQGDQLPVGASVLFDLAEDQGERKVAYQFYLPSNRMYALTNRLRRPPTPYVFAPLGDPEVGDAGGEVLWVDPEVPIALYRVAGWAEGG